MKPLILLCFILVFSAPVHAQHDVDQIENFIQNIMADVGEIPGLAISVVKDGEPYYLNAFGYAQVTNRLKADTSTSYYIASVTKSYVGMLASILHEEGVIDIYRPITAYAPIKHFRNREVFEEVTIAELLSHTSGLINHALSWQFSDIGNYDRQLLLHILETKTSSLYNNKSFRYDNFGYNVFDLILSEELGLSWKDGLKQRIFNPLSMKHTTAFLDKAVQKNWQIATPYTSINRNRLPSEAKTKKNEATYQAAGGMLTSAADIQKWMYILLGNGRQGKQSIIPEAAIDRAFTSMASYTRRSTFFENQGYGLGWHVGSYKEKPVRYHLGGFDGYFAHLSLMPEEGIGIAVLVNESHFGDNVGNLIAQYIYDLLLKEKDLEGKYAEEKTKLLDRIDRIQHAFEEDRQIRSHRKFTLIHPFEDYRGTYRNEYFGDLKIQYLDKNGFDAQLGILKAHAEPSRNDDSIRVEFRDGNGRDILFISNASKVFAAVYQGYVFIKETD